MAKMDESTLLAHLQALEEDSASFTWGKLGSEREKSMREYFRMPYGNEEEGWSSIVTSDVQDTVEWALPALLKIFTSTDKTVVFEPSRANDVKGAEQATEGVNYVFHKQNNGFLILYTAFKDALTVRNCAVHWRKETKRVKSIVPVRGATEEMLTMLLQEHGPEAELEEDSIEQLPPQPMMGPQGPMVDQMTGQPMMGPALFNARICKYEQKTTVKVEAFPPEDLLIKRDWTSPLLAECPYVARILRVTLSDLKEMGFKDVTREELDESDNSKLSADASFRQNRVGADGEVQAHDDVVASDEDEALTEGYLRLEYVLADVDGDGVAERRCIYRLKDRILSNEECASVPIATASPILVPHRWDGMSLADAVSDLQQLNTELTRQMLNSAYLSNSPRKKVLTDANWSPLANIDDLLDSRPGAILRQKQGDAISDDVTPFVGGQMLPLLEHVQQMRDMRTGVSRASAGMDPNSLRNDRTAVEVMQTGNAAAQRIELIARILAEVLIKPIFQGILKELTEGGMEKLAFRLRGEFVEYDPNEWRDSYDMTVNVGLGTGDKQQQLAALGNIAQSQMALAQSPFGPLMITAKNIYNTHTKLVENAGFKNVGDFYTDPGDQKPQPPQTPPDPKIQIEQMKLQADAQKFQAEQLHTEKRLQLELQLKQREAEMQAQLQASNDERDAQRELLKAQYQREIDGLKLELDKYKTDVDNQTRIKVALIAHPGETGVDVTDTGDVIPKPDPLMVVTQALQTLSESLSRPKAVVRDESGRVVGVQ